MKFAGRWDHVTAREGHEVSRCVMVGAFSFARRKEGSDAVLAWPQVKPGDDRCAELVTEEQGWSSKFAVSCSRLHSPLTTVGSGADSGNVGMMSRSLATRRGLQALALVLATSYATMLLYQAVVQRQVIRMILIASYPRCRRFYGAPNRCVSAISHGGGEGDDRRVFVSGILVGFSSQDRAVGFDARVSRYFVL